MSDRYGESERAAVLAGVAVLDEHIPDWRGDVDRDALEMTRGDRCVLGQAWPGGYHRAIEELIGIDAWRQEAIDWSGEHGFMIKGINEDPEDEDLDDLDDEELETVDRSADWLALQRAWQDELSD